MLLIPREVVVGVLLVAICGQDTLVQADVHVVVVDDDVAVGLRDQARGDCVAVLLLGRVLVLAVGGRDQELGKGPRLREQCHLQRLYHHHSVNTLSCGALLHLSSQWPWIVLSNLRKYAMLWSL